MRHEKVEAGRARARRGSVLAIGIVALLSGAAFAWSADVEPGAAALERLKSLEGRWTGGEGDSAYVMEFDVIAGGRTVLAREFADTAHEMTTMYYLRGGELVAQHYCVLGNQPRYRHLPSDDPAEIRFGFDGGENLDPARDHHAHEGFFRWRADGTLESSWTFWKDGQARDGESFVMRRAQ